MSETITPEQGRAAMEAHAKEMAERAEATANDPLSSSEGDRNCLSYWFPKLAATGVPVPRTEIVRTAVRLDKLLDGKTPDGYEGFLTALQDAANRIGSPPWFLRTGQGSGKHQWRDTAFVRYRGELHGHIAALVEWSCLVDFLGLPFDVWAVREMLPTRPIAVLPAYRDFPLVREVRAFVKDGKVVCVHPYWPAGAVREGFGMRERHDDESDGPLVDLVNPPAGPKVWKPGRFAVPVDLDKIIAEGCRLPTYLSGGWPELLEAVAAAFAGDGAWSVDVLETDRGWYVTDMAEAYRSFHWAGCEKAKELSPC